MRYARWLVIALLMCAGVPFASAIAEPVTYEFEGFLTTNEACRIGFAGGCTGDPVSFYPDSFAPGTKFTGTITLDTTLTGPNPLTGEVGTSPVLEFELRTAAGDTIHRESPSGADSYVTTSQRQARLGYATLATSSTTDEVDLRYHAAVDGQIPADTASFDPTRLQPSHWLLLLNRADCFGVCRPFDSYERFLGHITAIRRQGSGGPAYMESFTSTPAGWTSQGGSWSAVNGEYRNAANVSFTSSIHAARSLTGMFEISARLFSGFGASGNTLGLVFNYHNPSNFYEVRFNPLGTVTFNAVVNGTRTMLQSGRYQTSGAGTWFNVTVRRSGNTITVFAGGSQIFDILGAQLVAGHAGVFASWNRARFDDFRLVQGGGATPWSVSLSTFDSSAPGWTPLKGSWSVQNGRYGNSTNASFVVSLANQTVGTAYSINADIRPSWRNSGNQSGFVYDYENAGNYREVRLVPRPSGGLLARFVEVRAGVRTVVAEWSPSLLDPRQVLLVRRGDVTIARSGVADTFALVQHAPRGAVRAGLLASWNLVTFDNVVVGALTQ